MNLISCFIIDDELSIELVSQYILSIPNLKLHGYAPNPSTVSYTFSSIGVPEVLFINTDFIDDFEVALNEYKLKHQTLIVVTSSQEKNAFQAFELGCVDYLLKPLGYERFLKTINRVTNGLKGMRQRNWFYIQSETKGKIIRITHDEIKYIEANSNYIIIVINSGQHITYKTMKLIEQKLPGHTFIRVHKSFIVNETRIHSLSHDCVVLNDKTVIKIGPNYRERVRSKLLT